MMHDRDISELLDAAEALTRFAQAASHPKVDRHAAQLVHEHLVDAFNAAMHAVLKPKPVPVDDVPPALVPGIVDASAASEPSQ